MMLCVGMLHAQRGRRGLGGLLGLLKGGLTTTRLCMGKHGGVSHYTGSVASGNQAAQNKRDKKHQMCNTDSEHDFYEHGNSDTPNFPTWKFGQSEFSDMEIRTIRIFSIGH